MKDRICKICGTTDPNLFFRYGRVCKPCRNQLSNKKRNLSPEAKARKKAYNKSYYQNNKEDWNSGPNSRFHKARQAAKDRNKEWQLTISEYYALIAQPCDYCNEPLPTTGIGLDRKDNSIGYTTSNVTPCCYVCNTAKSDNFTYDEMKRLGKIIIEIIAARKFIS